MNQLLPIAEIPREVIPLVGILMLLMIPIIGLLTWHQQRMTMLMNQNADHSNNEEIRNLRSEIMELKNLVASMALQLDHSRHQSKSDNAIQDRIEVGK